MARVLAFDLGGSRLKAGLVEAARVTAARTVPAPPVDELVAGLRGLGDALLAGERATRVGLCVPGLVERGTVVALPGKLDGIAGIDLARLLRETFGADVQVVNDAIAYAIGETTHGAGRGAGRVVVVTIGTGVGVGVVERGRPLGEGKLGGGLLGGQIPIGADGSDTSGRAGTIEALCRAQRLVDLSPAHGSVEALYRAHAAGDEAAAHAVARYRADLARALVALAHAHAPDRIVVGGGPITPENPLLLGIADLVRPHLFAGYDLEIVPAALGDGAALIGLAALAEEQR